MENQIMVVVEAEVERRVNAKLGEILKFMAGKYDLNLERLMRDVAGVDAHQTQCLGLIGKGSRCTRHARNHGYCNIHQGQAPKAAAAPSPPQEVVHTHTLPPLFLEGCPACEKMKKNRLNI
jgi:hypothetical protein